MTEEQEKQMNRETTIETIKAYQDIVEVARERIQKYITKFYGRGDIFADSVTFDLEHRRIDFTYYTNSHEWDESMPLDCLFANNWEEVAQADIDRQEQLRLEYEKKMEEDKKAREIALLISQAKKLGFDITILAEESPRL